MDFGNILGIIIFLAIVGGVGFAIWKRKSGMADEIMSRRNLEGAKRRAGRMGRKPAEPEETPPAPPTTPVPPPPDVPPAA